MSEVVNAKTRKAHPAQVGPEIEAFRATVTGDVHLNVKPSLCGKMVCVQACINDVIVFNFILTTKDSKALIDAIRTIHNQAIRNKKGTK